MQENPIAAGAPSKKLQTQLGSLERSQTLNWWGGGSLSSPKNHTPRSGPFRPELPTFGSLYTHSPPVRAWIRQWAVGKY